MNSIVILGASGHARVVADILLLEGRFTIAGFLDDINTHLYGTEYCGSTILGGRERLPELYRQGIGHAIVAIGNNAVRDELARLVLASGFRLGIALHPRAVISAAVSISEGVVVAAGAVINPGSFIGANTIVNTAASVDHDCAVGSAVHVGPGARLGGWVTVENGAWIGIGAVIKDRVRIGANSLIGAGAVVLKDIPPGVVAFGVPARIQRTVTLDDWF